MSHVPVGDERASVDAAPRTDDEGFRLLSIDTTSTPSGCVGRDWLVYRIAQGNNIIVGYRRGDLEAVSAEVETIVTSLNDRRRVMKNKPGPKRGGRRAAAPAPAQASGGDEDHD